MALDYNCPYCGKSLGYDGLCYECRNEKERNEVLAWTEEEIRSKIEHLVANVEQIENWRTEEYRTVGQLLGYRGIFPEELQRAAVMAGVFYLDKLYYHAPADVRDMLIEKLLKVQDSLQASRLLKCLAMQGDDRALEVMLELEHHPREWRKQLYVDPSVYAECGGWTFDKNGNRRMLNYETCYPMIKGHKKDLEASPVKIGRPREDNCIHCKGQLADMLVLDGRDERLKFLGIDGIFTASCCPNCVPYVEAAFSRFDLDGSSQVLEGELDIDGVEDYFGAAGMQQLSGNGMVLAEDSVPPFYESDGDTVNTIGGYASWVQDWYYAKCPDCGKHMKYIAQLHWGVLTEDEGTLYIEMCPECHVAAMIHQQT